MPDNDNGQQTISQNTTHRYLKRAQLQSLLERLFPGQTEFKIQMRDDQWCFSAPRKIEDADIDAVREQ
ncbi:hypothetical protein BGW36DRAFT_427558 [Talaromyces proteolyticus]|uniref:Uncharacterized protein n=1 Tax=Talaromyces proteolyticus TaxID=1131652 RepID=A0AAD4KSX4_9EURO|nr:uncharacterized protein BGW36DRAFT_427558 [Talaromyces proteolyticus]KAH8697602.1 hypothetical protein BGW36DRAFT_427558 [Talaromyces proteolyticus]